MKRRGILFLIVLVVLGVISYLGYSILSKVKEKSAITEQLQTIPEFEFLTLEQKTFTKSNLKEDKKTVFIYFNSQCDFCLHEALSISENLDSFKNEQFIFLSTESIVTIRQFAKQYHLENQDAVTFLHDSNNVFSNQFDATTIPYLLIYDKEQKLIKRHKGPLNAKGILKVLNRNE